MTFALAHLGTSWHILAPLRAWPNAGHAVCPSASEKLCSFLQVSVARLARYNCASAACKQFVTATACHSLSQLVITSYHVPHVSNWNAHVLHVAFIYTIIYNLYMFCPFLSKEFVRTHCPLKIYCKSARLRCRRGRNGRSLAKRTAVRVTCDILRYPRTICRTSKLANANDLFYFDYFVLTYAQPNILTSHTVPVRQQ